MGSKKSKGKSKSKKSSKSKISKKKKQSGEKLSDKSERNSSEERNSRYFIGEKNYSPVQNFSRVREDYFKYLQVVVIDNCALFGFEVTKETLESFALELEKDALLACLQIDIYKKFMWKIISDIEKCTKAEQIHEEVRKLLLGSTEKETCQPKTESQEGEIYRIPTIYSTRSDGNSNLNEYNWAEESIYNSDSCYPVMECYQKTGENYDNEKEEPWNNEKEEPWNNEKEEPWNNEKEEPWNNEKEEPWNNEKEEPWNNEKEEPWNNEKEEPWNNEVNQHWNNVCCTTEIDSEPIQNEAIDPLLESRNQLQKMVEKTLKQTEQINKQKKDEKERAHIAQILEGEDSLDDRLNDSLSDNENESKENIDESNLMDRLEKMKEIFGVDSNDDAVLVEEKEKPKKPKMRRPSIWKHEKVIQQHKFALIASEMTFQRRYINRKLFEDLFGVDSDEEREGDYMSEERYRTNCVERISSWVVKYLMPFYQAKKVIGRDVFKALGHRISNDIIDEIQYPDEWTVKYFVSKFFPSKKKYVCHADIIGFRLD